MSSEFFDDLCLDFCWKIKSKSTEKILDQKLCKTLNHCTEVRFAGFLSSRFITAIVVNPPERKLAKRTSVKWSKFSEQKLGFFSKVRMLKNTFNKK